MEEQKKSFDYNTLIGFLLIGGIILYMLSTNKNEQVKKDDTTKAQTENVVDSSSATTNNPNTLVSAKDSTTHSGVFKTGNSTAKAQITTIENEVLKIKVSSKGGQIVTAKLKGMTNADSLPVYLIKNHNATLNISFLTTENKKINTKDLHFEPELSKHNGNTVLSMKAQMPGNKYLEYVYTLKPNEYMMGFDVHSQGLTRVINQAAPVKLHWKLKGYSHDRSVSFENRFTESVWRYEDGKTSSQGSDGTEKDKNVDWIAYRQHFFSSILLNDSPFKKGTFTVKNLVENEDIDTVYSKAFTAVFPLQLKGGEINENMNLYYGPSDYKLLSEYGRDLDEIIPLGWGIFGWINKFLFIPALSFLMSFLPAGIAIIILTIIVKVACSPVQYKQYMAQAKRKILQPEIDEINEKYKDNQMKRNQETMKLNSKAGINQTSGCIAGLLQAPIFFALYRLFPSAFSLRHESFLWVDDLASYDVIAHLPFTIPFYGEHVSLFPLLATAVMFFYMSMTTGQNMMPKQPGMPNMKFIMYIMPIGMLFFFNSYPSGLSLYYFTSYLISLGIVLVIKNYIIDEDKVHAKIQENKKKPKKQNRFQRKMQEMMAEAERQKELKEKNK